MVIAATTRTCTANVLWSALPVILVAKWAATMDATKAGMANARVVVQVMLPELACARNPAMELTIVMSRDVPMAVPIGMQSRSTSASTITNPPPTPSRPVRKPATRTDEYRVKHPSGSTFGQLLRLWAGPEHLDTGHDHERRESE